MEGYIGEWQRLAVDMGEVSDRQYGDVADPSEDPEATRSRNGRQRKGRGGHVKVTSNWRSSVLSSRSSCSPASADRGSCAGWPVSAKNTSSSDGWRISMSSTSIP